MKITKRQLRRIIREEKERVLKENIFQSAMDSVSDFFTGNNTVRAIDPQKAEVHLQKAVGQYVGSFVQDAVQNKGADTSEAGYQKLFDEALGKVQNVLDTFEDWAQAEVVRQSKDS